MKRHLNLYAADFRRERPPLDARRLAAIGAGSIALLAIAGAAVAWQTRSQEARVARLEDRRAAESTRVVELAALHPPREADPQLLASVSRLEAERAAKQELLSRLGSERLGNQRGFSEHVAGLARRHLDGVWLRELRLDRGGAEILLIGSALSPELVPRFLDRLGAEDAFAGSEFRSLRLERTGEPPGRLDFRAHTHEAPQP